MALRILVIEVNNFKMRSQKTNYASALKHDRLLYPKSLELQLGEFFRGCAPLILIRLWSPIRLIPIHASSPFSPQKSIHKITQKVPI